MPKKNRQTKIIIVGAGIAGLAACTRLIEHGFDAMILEARNRAGGRILIDHTMGTPLGLGASWIHGADANPITLLAKEFKANMVAVEPTKFTIFDRDGHAIPRYDIDRFNAKFEIILKKAKEFALASKTDISLSAALSGFIKPESLSPLEQDLLKSKITFFEGYIGGNYEYLSARHWDQEEAWPGKNCFLTSTYQPILEGLLKNCPVQLNSQVREINTRENDVELVTKNSIFQADAVIVTIPLGVLKKNSITFNPPLPDDKQKAIQHLGMGIFNITAIKFPTAFWPKEPPALFFTQFDDLSIPVFLNLYHFNHQPIIVGYSGGERARRLERLPDAELIEKTMNNFKTAFGPQLPEPEAYLNTRWSIDPFSYGSYSHIPVGATGNDYNVMANPASDRLFFAGEATHSKYPSTTHGAYLSGIREAERIIKLFS